jgi:hypothetical protein
LVTREGLAAKSGLDRGAATASHTRKNHVVESSGPKLTTAFILSATFTGHDAAEGLRPLIPLRWSSTAAAGKASIEVSLHRAAKLAFHLISNPIKDASLSEG